jgi:hypothetical protein
MLAEVFWGGFKEWADGWCVRYGWIGGRKDGWISGQSERVRGEYRFEV